MELWRAFGNPPDEFGKTRMCAQRIGCIEIARQFRLGQGRMDFIVTNLVQQHRRTALAAFQLGNEVVMGLLCMRRNGTPAKRALRVFG